MFRSETMKYYSCVISKENSWKILDKFGAAGVIHFQDLNKETLENQKSYYSQLDEIKSRLSELENIQNVMSEWDLKILENEASKEKINEGIELFDSLLKKMPPMVYLDKILKDVKKDHKSL